MRTFSLIISFCVVIILINTKVSYAQPKFKSDPETIINGKLWIPSHTVSLGDQFFLDKLKLNGSIIFDKTEFKNIELFYDISTDELITPISTENKTKCNIVLNKELLNGFTLVNNHQHYKFKKGTLIHKNLAPNEYYQIYKSNTKTYLIKHRKIRSLNSNSGSDSFKYINENKMYIISNNTIIDIRNKRSLLSLFKRQKKELKQYIRINKLKITKHSPWDVIPILNHFDS
jgi:hypothetical protein